MRAITLPTLMTLFVMSHAVAAAEIISTAESFVDICISGNAVFCRAYMKGFFAGTFSAQAFATIKIKTCMPDHLSDDTALHVFYDFLKKHPERAQDDFMNVAFSALSDAYPCKSSN